VNALVVAVAGTIARPGPGSSRLDVSVSGPPWLKGEDAPCRRSDPELLFPDNYGLQYRKQIEEARDLCLSCPFLEDCRSWAVSMPELNHGIYAATTPPQRRRIRTGKLTDNERETAA
jgi:WhiB family redox-sensing transcriptional regulator